MSLVNVGGGAAPRHGRPYASAPTAAAAAIPARPRMDDRWRTGEQKMAARGRSARPRVDHRVICRAAAGATPSHIRIDAKRPAPDALDVQRGQVVPVTAVGTGGDPEDGDAQIEAIVAMPDGVTSPFDVERFPGVRKLLIPLNRRDVRVVEGARVENEAGQRRQATPKRLNAHAISDLTFQAITRCASLNFDVRRGFEPDLLQSYHNRVVDLGSSALDIPWRSSMRAGPPRHNVLQRARFSNTSFATGRAENTLGHPV